LFDTSCQVNSDGASNGPTADYYEDRVGNDFQFTRHEFNGLFCGVDNCTPPCDCNENSLDAANDDKESGGGSGCAVGAVPRTPSGLALILALAGLGLAARRHTCRPC
jgi:hypothetical protein